ncbi:MAG: TonB-dependent receptor [Pseudomonadota bacterium]
MSLLFFVCSGLRAESTDSAVEGTESIQRYERAFFARFNPQTALDLVERLPGFTLDQGNENLRGFGGAAGNVLIDGERPSLKSGGIEDSLRRIPADNVERIEVIRGSAGLSEAAGQSVVANVVRKTGGTGGSWSATVQRAADGKTYPSGELTLTRKIGEWDTSTKFNGFWERFPLKGPRIQRDSNGELISSQSEDRPSVFWQAFVSTDADRPFAGGKLTVTARAGQSHFLPDTERLGFDGRLPDGNPDERFFIDFDSIFKGGELGVDWTRPSGKGWSTKLLSFTSISSLDDEQIVTTERPIGDLIRGSTFELTEDQAEAILRATYGKTDQSRLRPEFGGEFAYNRQESALSLETREGDTTTVITLPAANVTVEEVRAEVFANLIWQIAERMTLESGFAFEASEISVSGDADNSQRFSFAKPFATLIYDVREGFQTRLGVRRSVGQLNFSQFAASAEAADDRLLGGNPELGPDQTTRASLTFDLRSETRGAFNIEFFHEWREDVIEQVELASGAFGAANAGRGEGRGATTVLALPLNSFIPGGLLELEADIRTSDFDDPLSGMNRDLSNVRSPTLLAEFRQDLTDRQISWGISYEAGQDNSVFFADEESFSTNGSFWSAFIETTRFRGIRTRFSLRNIGERNFFRERRFFEPSRAGPFSGSETIDRDRGMFITLSFTGQLR